MMRVHVLHDASYTRNGEAFVFPLRFNRRRLADRGVRLTFSTDTGAPFECDVLCVSSRCFRTWWTATGGDAVLEWLGRARRTTRTVLWFDVSDSTGTTQFRVLPAVDGYVKNQLLKDRSLYQASFYGMRITTDFYHRHFGVRDEIPQEPHLAEAPDVSQIGKVRVGWNYGMANYGPRGAQLGSLWHRAAGLPRWYARRWYRPDARRPIPCSLRVGHAYARQTVAFPRQRLLELTRGRLRAARLPRAQYFRELRLSVVAISPFGFGEVCYRDFEAVTAGAAVMKQDMSHVDTWPDLWARDMYVPFAWDFSNFDDTLQQVFDQPDRMADIASRAQDQYRRLLDTEDGHQEFCSRFLAAVSCG